jgi:uroporphyrin-3 C-methyltransferase
MAGARNAAGYLARDLRAQSQRLQDAAATNRVLRDEVLALGQREALLEDSLGKLNDNTRRGSEALHLDEVASMLALGERRLRIAGDLDGARRLCAGGIDTGRHRRPAPAQPAASR